MKLKILAIGITLMILCGSLIATAKLNNNNTKNTEKEHYYSYKELTELLNKLQQEYPEIFDYSSLGKTWEGRDIWLVKISDNVNIEEEEAEVFFTGGMHGDEKQTYEVVIYTIKAFLENYTSPIVNQSFTERVRNVINNSEIYLIPMLNPDGVEARTRKNARPNNCPFGKTLLRGVDINRNSGYKWELQDEHPFKYRRSFPYIEKINVRYPIFDFRSIIGEGCYRGPYNFSEPESMAIKQVVENHNISIYVDYHSAANLIIYGWAWDNNYPIPNETVFFSIAQNISNMTGYVIKRSMTRNFGNIRDWMLAEHGVYTFVIELPPINASKPLMDIMHGNSFPSKNIPILEICETHVFVNLYFVERAMAMTNQGLTNPTSTIVPILDNKSALEKKQHENTPGFVIILVIVGIAFVAIALILFWKQKRIL